MSNVKNCYIWLLLFRLNPRRRGFPGCQRMAKVPKNEKKIAENFNRLSTAHGRYRRQTDSQTDGTAIAYSEREREFTFA